MKKKKIIVGVDSRNEENNIQEIIIKNIDVDSENNYIEITDSVNYG